MATRIAVISIVIENDEKIEEVNRLLHQYSSYVIGRMGIPYRERGLNIISVAIEAPQDRINALTGSLGKLEGITARAACSKQFVD